MSAARAPGAALLHPLAPLSLLLLLFNDHWLKHHHPGVLSGKLSDFAAMFLMPVLLHAVFEVTYGYFTGKAPRALVSNRALLCCITLSCLAFALPEIWKPAEAVYRVVGALLKWPFLALFAGLRAQAWPALRPVAATADVSDLLALSSAYLAWRVARRGVKRALPQRTSRVRAVLAALFAVAALAHAAPASAAGSQPFLHDGFFMNFQVGPELIWVHSPASASNGFQQPIASTATGFAPGGMLELGGTLRGTGLVLGGALGYAQVENPIVRTLGQRFELRGGQLSAFNFGAFARYYPNPKQGFHLGLSLSAVGLEMSGSSGDQLRGGGLGLEAGHGIWLGRQFTLGVAARVTAAALRGDVPGTTVLLMPGVFATLAWH
jgi:hypothetical protein